MLKQLDTDLWVTSEPLRFYGLELGARMTVVRLRDGRLLLHSPITPSESLLPQVTALGPVAFLVAPNCYHHLSVAAWHEAFKDAALYVAPGLDRKRPDLKVAGVLSASPEDGWRDSLDQTSIEGLPLLNEVVFFHRPSRTLIATDLAFNMGHSSAPLTGWFFRLVGTHGRLSPTPLERLMVRDRTAFRRSLERVLAWPFERVVVAHGDVSEHGGREELMGGYAWALQRSR